MLQSGRRRLPGTHAYSPAACGAGQLHQGAFASRMSSCCSALADVSALQILLATDNHIGYAENDPVRGKDSINTFREILQLAVANDVGPSAVKGA